MTHRAEELIRSPGDEAVVKAIREAFPDQSDTEITVALTRLLVSVAVIYNDVAEGEISAEVGFDREVFGDLDELSHYFPWPQS